MQELQKGHLSNRLHFNRKDEIGDLTHAMDQFADNLQQNVIFSMQQIIRRQYRYCARPYR